MKVKRAKGSNQYKTRYKIAPAAVNAIALLIAIAIAAVSLLSAKDRCPCPILSPLPETPPTSTPTPQPKTRVEGWVSWYGTGERECLGCNRGRIMANGERLDDRKATVACDVKTTCKLFPLGSKVRIINLENMMTTVATVTDTGGFGRYGRVLDVTKKVRDLVNADGNFYAMVERIE